MFIVSKFQEIIKDFEMEDVLAFVTFLNRERFIIIVDKLGYDDNDVLRDHKIKGLTERGYKTLDLIKDDNLWNEIKEKLTNYDELSIYAILSLAKKIVNVKQMNYLIYHYQL